MAVYTHVDDEALSAFLSAYDVGELLSAKGIAEGVENTNYLVRAEKGIFILTLYEQRVRAEELPFFLNLMAHCADKGLATPRPVPRSDGALIIDVADPDDKKEIPVWQKDMAPWYRDIINKEPGWSIGNDLRINGDLSFEKKEGMITISGKFWNP